MREPGGGTLFSPVIEKAKLSVKVAMTESSENKRQLSSNGGVGGYASYVGAKSMLAGSVLPPAAPFPASPRLKGGNSNAIFAHTPFHENNAGLDLSAAERLKELRARLEPFLKLKAAQPTSGTTAVEEGGALPHWGLGKRLRRSRFEVSKHGLAHDSAGKARGEGQAVEDCGVKQRGHGWAARPVHVDAADVAHFTKGTAPSRNGLSGRAAANGVPATSTQAKQGNGREREIRGPGVLQPHKGEASGTGRQRSDGSAERPINSINGQVGARTTVSAVVATETAAAFACPVNPRLDLQTLEWPRILIALTRKEKEDDFLIFKGSKLSQRPKKRPKAVERALHYCMPGNSLCDLSRSRYDVKEKKSARKRRRGLKAMESMESDSD